MMVRLDFWYEFASTYSYPAAMRVEKLAQAHDVSVRWRPFLLGPVFADLGWRDSPFNIYPAKGRYMWRDLERICEREGLPFRKPDPFPQNSLLAARIATALDGDDRARFSRAVYAAEFCEGRSIDDLALLGSILNELRLPRDILDRAGSEPVKAALRASVEEAKRLGLFGAPSFVTQDGELFWGDDRLEAALDWAIARA
jgi:2-hydroxychromene-2-carboxylate isomerase